MVHRIAEGAVVEGVHHAPDGRLGVVLHVPHERMHGPEAVMREHPRERTPAGFVGGQLRFQVRDVLFDLAHRMRTAGQHPPHVVLEERAARHHLQVVDDDALVLDGAAVGRHRARGDAADVRVVAARPHEGHDVAPELVEYGRDCGEIGQVGPAVVRRIEHEGVAGLHPPGPTVHDGPDAVTH